MDKKLQKFIDNARFMASSLSYLVDNLTEKIHNMDMIIKHVDLKIVSVVLKKKC